MGSHRRAGHRTPTAGNEGLLPVALGQITAFGAKAEGFIPEEGFRQETNVQDGGREALDSTGEAATLPGPGSSPLPCSPAQPCPGAGRSLQAAAQRPRLPPAGQRGAATPRLSEGQHGGSCSTCLCSGPAALVGAGET